MFDRKTREGHVMYGIMVSNPRCPLRSARSSITRILGEGSPTTIDYRKASWYQLLLTSLLEDLVEHRCVPLSSLGSFSGAFSAGAAPGRHGDGRGCAGGGRGGGARARARFSFLVLLGWGRGRWVVPNLKIFLEAFWRV